MHELATAAGDRGPLVLLLSYCGLRYGEAAGLTVADVDLLRRRLAVNRNAVEVGTKVIVGTPKGHRRRTVPVPAFLLSHLARQCTEKGRGDLLFPRHRRGITSGCRIRRRAGFSTRSSGPGSRG